MSKDQIKHLIERHLPQAGLVDTALKGVQLFRVTETIPCVPVVYEPTVVAILNGTKEAVLDGEHHIYDSDKYMLCPMTLPVEAGTPRASKVDPLLGVVITLEPRVMRELTMDIETASGGNRQLQGAAPQALELASWDAGFTQALLRLLELLDNPVHLEVLGTGRLRELYYAVLMGEAGGTAKQAFGVGNEIARTIDYLANHLNKQVTIDEMADYVGMSRAVFHRRFKEATTMSPIQFVKSMRLNNAAMKIAEGKTVSEAAWDAGYQSYSQFSREFKRMYGQSPRKWSNDQQLATGADKRKLSGPL
ncbi:MULTISPECIES: AraC family transcriptional regulator [Halocynthiibacter]|uniref:AraC family transcriptional regulator n=1 Tax=Halocynthiibacter halioticoli TaxID=2986804 RepID=A0AAE3IVG2_9RHOB|nr:MULTISPECIES: AraC family transcriptional regulator [Halocynthiibacter]MCV6822922.1 AraC family transcriptional regulator [Halocynthiibacter halioticoli]MCW4055923.1 AraC family transcriptional regulator [Halocynthiibacter sp. SDUM655004]